MSWEEKYLKYKNKYLNLKYSLTGGSENEWMRLNPITNKWEELAFVDKGNDIPQINATIEKVRLLEGKRDDTGTHIEKLPSGRSLKLTFTYHPDGAQITKYEYSGSSVSCIISKGLNKNKDFIMHVVTGRQFTEGGTPNFNSKEEAISYITTNFGSYLDSFTSYKNKPSLEQIVAYINSLPDTGTSSITSIRS